MHRLEDILLIVEVVIHTLRSDITSAELVDENEGGSGGG